MARDYKAEAARESPERKRHRRERVRARRMYFKYLAKKYGEAKAKQMMEGKEVDHIKPLSQGGSNSISNLRLRPAKENRADKGTIFAGKKTTRPEAGRGKAPTR